MIFDFENGKTVKYNFSTKTAIGLSGKPVKDLKSQLSGITIKEIIECCDDEKYASFLDFVRRKCGYNIINIGTVLSHVPRYSKYEQIFSAGMNELIRFGDFTRTINDIPKSLIKISKKHNVKITDHFCDFWNRNIDSHLIGYKLKYVSLDDNDIFEILESNQCRYIRDKKYYIYHSYFNKLIEEYGYNAKSLFLYIDHLKTFEAIEDMSFLLEELYDYARMMNEISSKFDKYPRNFLTTHKIACRNYNRLKKEFQEELFKRRINEDYECSFGEYKFIYPKTTQEIKDEAVSQNNCVASYIDRVIDGKCHILFLRKKNDVDKSLVTLEVRNNCIVQAKRHFNDPITPEEREVIEKWNKKFSKIKEVVV